VDKVDICMPWRSEENGVAGGASRGGVGGEIISAEVDFDLHNAPGEQFTAFAPDNEFSQQLARDHAGIAVEEGAGKKAGVGFYLKSRAERGIPIPSRAFSVTTIHHCLCRPEVHRGDSDLSLRSRFQIKRLSSLPL